MKIKNKINGENRTIIFIFTAITILCIDSIASATVVPVNSNSKVLDGIEYYIQTDKSVYTLGENVEMIYKVSNLSSETVTFNFSTTKMYELLVEQDGSRIWQIPTMGYTIPSFLTLLPGEFREFPFNPPFIWDMKNNNNVLVGLGTYDVIGGLYNFFGSYDYTKVGVPIQIVPEPATVLLFSLGMLGIISRYRKKSII